MNPTSLLEALRPINWPVFALISARVIGMMLIAPIWSTGVVPGRVRGAFAIVLTFALLPTVQAMPVEIAVPSLIVPLVTEALIGVAIGLAAATMMYAVSIAAEVISLQMGLSLGVALGGPSDAGSPGIGQLYHQLFLVIYVAGGGAIMTVRAVADSYQVIPAGGAIELGTNASGLIQAGGGVFVTAVQIAAPVMVALLLANLALAIVNRAIPQLNTMMVAVPVTVAIGFIAIGGALPLTASLIGQWLGGVGGQSAILVQQLAPHVGP